MPPRRERRQGVKKSRTSATDSRAASGVSADADNDDAPFNTSIWSVCLTPAGAALVACAGISNTAAGV